jgi:hypothetical protein
MSISSSPRETGVPGRVVLVAPGRALGPLAPLIDAYQEGRPVEVVRGEDLTGLDGHLEAADAVLVVAAPRRSPRTVLPGVAVETAAGRRIPVGVVPNLGDDALRRFARAAASVHARPDGRPSVALLAQRSPRYRDLAGRVGRVLTERTPATPVSWWTADRLVRDDLATGLGLGLGVALYVGHGRPVGWVGYRGTRAHHLPTPEAPVGAILSLACLTASRRRTGLSFGEALVMRGCAAASLAAVKRTLHLDNARWALGIARALAEGAATIGELVVLAEPPAADRCYRILGDPLAPLRDTPGARDAAREFEDLVLFPSPGPVAS